MMNQPTEGVGLEARLLRVFLSQGSFAERRLWPAADARHRMLATDIDVLVSEYGSGFDLTRRHVECKGGKSRLLDRILWLSGVRTLLEAETSYLVLPTIDYDASRFAWGLNVQLMGAKQLTEWETSLKIPAGRWPCRSDFRTFETARSRWHKATRQRDADEVWRLLSEILAFVEVDSWLEFQYRLLNRLLRYLATLGEKFGNLDDDAEKALLCRYCASALLVRLAQYLLAICLDVTPVAGSELKNYVTERLTFGDQNPRYVQSIVRDTVRWVKQALAEKRVELPAAVDTNRLFEPPPYVDEFVELVHQLVSRSDEASCLPIALEVTQFDNLRELGDFPRLSAAAAKGDALAALVKGFVIRNAPVPRGLLEGIAEETRASNHSPNPLYKSRANSRTSPAFLDPEVGQAAFTSVENLLRAEKD